MKKENVKCFYRYKTNEKSYKIKCKILWKNVKNDHVKKCKIYMVEWKNEKEMKMFHEKMKEWKGDRETVSGIPWKISGKGRVGDWKNISKAEKSFKSRKI